MREAEVKARMDGHGRFHSAQDLSALPHMEKEQMGLVVEQGGGKSSEGEIYEVRMTSKQNDA